MKKVSVCIDLDDEKYRAYEAEAKRRLAEHGVPVEVRLCDRLFTVPNPLGEKDRDYREFINEHSMDVFENVIVEPAVAEGGPGDFYQFERTGYFCHDNVDSKPGSPVLNRIVTLRDSWARIEKELARKR